MAGSGRKAVVLGLMLLALCTFQRHKFHVSGASVRRSFATLVGPSLNAPQVRRPPFNLSPIRRIRFFECDQLATI